MTELKIEKVPLHLLQQDPENSRLHDERNLQAIRGSLERFGQVEPLVVRKGTYQVIGGNGRLEVMRALGWTEADVVSLDVTEIEAKALSVTLNRTAELAEWDFKSLAAAVRAIKKAEAGNIDLSGLGWSDHELEPLLSADWNTAEKVLAKNFSFKVTTEQRMTIDRGVVALRERESDFDIAEGRAVQMICDEWKAGL